MEKKEKIREFWDEKAECFGPSIQATLGEIYLRKLEIRTMYNILARQKPPLVLEIGCGNGFSTFVYAKKLPYSKIFAVDYSERLLDVAKRHYSRENIEYQLWDVTETEIFPFDTKEFDVIFSQRVIQNLTSWNEQKEVIKDLLNRLKSTGVLVLMECSEEGVEQLNTLRLKTGREPIKGIIPWHNTFIKDSSLREEFYSSLVKIGYFSSTYMFLTRIISSRLAKIAWLFPPIGRFGYDRIYILRNP